MLILLLVVVMTCVLSASAIPLSDFYRFGSKHGDDVIARGDDASSPFLNKTVTVFGRVHNMVQVLTNGVIRLEDGEIFSCISPFASDYDTTTEDGGFVWYRCTTEPTLLQRALNDTQRAYPNTSSLEYLLIATWDHVGYYPRRTDKTNTFQGVVAVGNNQTYAIYLYADGLMEFIEDDDSGGANMMNNFGAGYQSQDIRFYVNDSRAVPFSSNVGCPGMWVFRINEEELVLPESEKCDNIHTLNDRIKCPTSSLKQSFECTHRYGACVPFSPKGIQTICDGIYTPGVNYIYIPSNGNGRGNTRQFIRKFEIFSAIVLNTLVHSHSVCREPLLHLLCHYYYPPCGKAKDFTPPAALCPEQCRAITELCPIEWAEIVKEYINRVSPEGVGFLDCNRTGNYLAPLPHCCSDLPLNISGINPTGECCSQITDVTEAPSGSGLNVYTVIVPIAIVCLITLAAIGLLVYIVLRKFNQKSIGVDNIMSSQNTVGNEFQVVDHHYSTDPNTKEDGDTQMPVILSDHTRKMSDRSLLISEKYISTLGIVGEGEFGIVYRAILQDRGDIKSIVAVKTLKGIFSSSDLQQLVEESHIMARFDHPNVMKLLGVTISGNKTFIVMPFMSQGSLLSYLRKHRAELTIDNADTVEMIEETSIKLLSMCLQIARGMEYLVQKKFVHRDLAARNCMIDDQNLIKVADFGLSEEVYARNYFRQTRASSTEGTAPVKLPVKWMALESLHDGVFSEKTDVWSFGVTCWEVFTLGKNPYPGVDPFSLIRYLERGERLDKPPNAACSQEIYEMMSECWDEEPNERPTFSQLVDDISTRLEGMSGYLELTV